MGPCNFPQSNNNRTLRYCYAHSKKHFSPSTSDYLLSNSLSKKTSIRKKYKVLKEFLGKGASGIVSVGTDKSGNRYAIKSINKLIIKNVINITSEVEMSLSFSNDHIIKCFDVYEDLKTISFVLELIEGGDLLDYIIKSPLHHLTDEECFEFIIQILDTLKYLHIDKRVVHRDIKPENFLVAFDNVKRPLLKLIDFGFATYVPERGMLNDNLGSPIYTAPEIIKGEEYDCKVDIWSAGVILFNMLTGFQPFSSEKSEEDIDKEVLSKDINFDTIQNVSLRELCKRMLEKDSNKRIDVIHALEIAKEINIQ